MSIDSKDQVIVCRCGKEFTFSFNEQAFFKANNYLPPKRCKECRVKKHAEYDAKESRVMMDKIRSGEKITLQ